MKIVTLALLISLASCTHSQRKPDAIPSEVFPKNIKDDLMNLPVGTRFEVSAPVNNIALEYNWGVLFGDYYYDYWCRIEVKDESSSVFNGEVLSSQKPIFPLTGDGSEIVIRLKSIKLSTAGFPNNLTAIRCSYPMSIEYFKKQMSPYFKIN